jgi:uncharacterized protein (DUF488 family)
MYYRRKILLALLQRFNGKLDKIRLQKFLFLMTKHQEQASYYFVPYKLGCYSFLANSDLHTLGKYGLTSETDKYWIKTDTKNYYSELKFKDQAAISFVKSHYGNLSKDELIRLTYDKYPYYAINSIIAKSILDNESIDNIKKQKPVITDSVLYTIGYEGIALEQYLNKLIIYDVKVLCDVRNNPMSMKYGFNKSQLKNVCSSVNVEYIHIPELGIKSDKRSQLNTQADYDKLFAYYRDNILSKEKDKLEDILNMLKTKRRIALTCFEANIFKCHRKPLAEYIARLNGVNYKIKHI